jgi:hypothetical protein
MQAPMTFFYRWIFAWLPSPFTFNPCIHASLLREVQSVKKEEVIAEQREAGDICSEIDLPENSLTGTTYVYIRPVVISNRHLL